MRTIGENGLALIARHEGGPYLNAILCPAGVPSLSYCVTHYPDGRPVKLGDKITWAQHLEMFRHATNVFGDVVNRNVSVPLNQNQFDALVCLAYNIGETNFRSSHVLKFVNLQRWEDASDAFSMWVYEHDAHLKNGRPWMRALPGLFNRHGIDEALLFAGLRSDGVRGQLEVGDAELMPNGEYKDKVLYRTSWDQLKRASPGPLLPQTYDGPQHPLDDVATLPPLPATVPAPLDIPGMAEAPNPTPINLPIPAPLPLPDFPAGPRPFNPVKSITMWAAGFMAIVSDPTVQAICQQLAGITAATVGTRLVQLGALFMILIGRVRAVTPKR